MSSTGKLMRIDDTTELVKHIAPWEQQPPEELLDCIASYIIAADLEDELKDEKIRDDLRKIPVFSEITMFQFNRALCDPRVVTARQTRRTRYIERGKDKLAMSVPDAVDALVELGNNSESEYVRMQALTTIVNASGVKAAAPPAAAIQNNITVNQNNATVDWRASISAPVAPKLFNTEFDAA